MGATTNLTNQSTCHSHILPWNVPVALCPMHPSSPSVGSNTNVPSSLFKLVKFCWRPNLHLVLQILPKKTGHNTDTNTCTLNVYNLSIYLSIYLPTYRPTYLPIYLPTYPSIYYTFLSCDVSFRSRVTCLISTFPQHLAFTNRSNASTFACSAKPNLVQKLKLRR